MSGVIAKLAESWCLLLDISVIIAIMSALPMRGDERTQKIFVTTSGLAEYIRQHTPSRCDERYGFFPSIRQRLSDLHNPIRVDIGYLLDTLISSVLQFVVALFLGYSPDFFCPESPNSFDIELILTPKRQSNIVSIRYDAIAAI